MVAWKDTCKRQEQSCRSQCNIDHRLATCKGLRSSSVSYGALRHTNGVIVVVSPRPIHFHCTRYHSANPKPGPWVNQQRSSYKLYQEGKPSPMTAERIRALEGIVFGWEASKTGWIVQFQQFCEFKAQFGHCLVPKRYSANPKLNWWVSTAQQLQVVPARKVKSHDRGAYSSTRWY